MRRPAVNRHPINFFVDKWNNSDVPFHSQFALLAFCDISYYIVNYNDISYFVKGFTTVSSRATLACSPEQLSLVILSEAKDLVIQYVRFFELVFSNTIPELSKMFLLKYSFFWFPMRKFLLNQVSTRRPILRKLTSRTKLRA
jgi:hypothetical protein